MKQSNKNIEIDFHNLTVEDSIKIVETLVNKARLLNKKYYCSFITGRGKIKIEIINILQNVYELEPYVPFANAGVINVVLE